MKQLLTCTFLFFSLLAAAQKEIFRSNQQFSKTDLEDFYSALSIHDSLILFKANDYTLYAYNKHTGNLLWKYYMKYKSNTGPHVAGNYIWTNTGETDGLRLDITGTNPKKLPFSIYTKPVVKNNLLYTTGIYDAGNVLSYDIAADSVVWFRFIAHGCDRQPYYLGDKIFANAEGNNWIEMDYNGKILNKDCEIDESGYASGDDCYDPFIIQTHDGNKLYASQAEKIDLSEYSNPHVITSTDKTFILDDARFSIIGKKTKKLFSKELHELGSIEEDNYSFSSILKADENHVWIMYSNTLIIFDHKKMRIAKMIDMQERNIHRAVADENNLWYISKKDGLLHGISISN